MATMTSRRFPPPWSVEDIGACLIVFDYYVKQLALARAALGGEATTQRPTLL